MHKWPQPLSWSRLCPNWTAAGPLSDVGSCCSAPAQPCSSQNPGQTPSQALQDRSASSQPHLRACGLRGGHTCAPGPCSCFSSCLGRVPRESPASSQSLLSAHQQSLPDVSSKRPQCTCLYQLSLSSSQRPCRPVFPTAGFCHQIERRGIPATTVFKQRVRRATSTP